MADRIEAAWKRQEQCYLDQIRDAMNMLGHERFVKEHASVGNAAAMREALVKIYAYAQTICAYKDEPTMVCCRADLIERIVNAALSAPPRNCDVMSVESAKKLWFVKEIMPRLDGDLPLGKEIPFEEWFVSQQEQGEGDGR